ncbi:hypothetical protein GE21DRAFT_864 [Neurospora crassa]|uniref:Uncharacterized protein n=2 Tax=Neurospora crassa TaxID=5141 RepID=Q7SH56_NEUCR|nr:hypothetical protein NCU02673 [Neurospora crassa OR74A]EAA36210.1 hypothetical protein NCU02673 [Neurospora crassa OR74A]KHE90118.1 hypothetical protein GE21DRAFT_864 [Neurospora crassa]CAE76482.1 hypothetical protein [Neurospora crassa]|eukprot:XP_965446.1 hypothetical protein NCU02673 [Neurospora crassa OR74A]
MVYGRLPLRDIFPAHHAIKLEIPERMDNGLFSYLLARPATAGKVCFVEHCSMLTASQTDRRVTVNWKPSTIELGGRSTCADRSEERTTCGGCSGRIPDRSLHLCHASVLKRYWANLEARALMNSHGLDISAFTARHVIQFGLHGVPLNDERLTCSAYTFHSRPGHPTLQTGPGVFHLPIRGPLVTVRGRLVHGHRLPRGSAKYTVGL